MSREDVEPGLRLPPSLLDLLSNSLIFDATLPYLPLSAIFSLFRTCHSFRDLISRTRSVFRYVDLSNCRGAYVPPNLLTRLDSGGHSWRAERMDENLTEDEFYAGPLRGVLWKLGRMNVLHSVQTLVLDDLASVTHDLVSDIVLGSDYNVRLLSIRRCLNVNQSKLQQLLRHICRPSRPEGTPRLQGLYVFAPPISMKQHGGTILLEGGHVGKGAPDNGNSCSITSDPWYAPTGQVITQGHSQRSSWEETLQACYGILSFDAVLCTHMHVDMAPVLHLASRDYLSEHKPGVPPLATISLGPEGCAGCGRSPHGAPVWGESDIREFPLLSPPPTSGKLIDAVRPPVRLSEDGNPIPQRLIVSCTWCLTNRHCDNCHRWWCADCYNLKNSKRLGDLERLSRAGLSYVPSRDELRLGTGRASESGNGDYLKVFNGLCINNCLVGEWLASAGGGGETWG